MSISCWIKTIGVFALMSVGQAASAASTTTYDANASEWSSSTLPSPTVIPIGGSGQVNGNFAIVSDASAGIEIGLRANQRFSPIPLPNTLGNYSAQPGESSPGLSTWNYDIHIDLRGSGLSFGDFDIAFTTDVPNHSTPDLQAALEFAGPIPPGTLSGIELFQTSLNPGFFASGINPFATGDYNFQLSLTPTAGTAGPTLVADMTVTVVPTPVAAGTGLFGLVFLVGRRRR